MQVVWFKKDLRVEDHAPLLLASKKGVVLPLYIVEPKLWCQPDSSKRQYNFLQECVTELDAQLQALGQGLVIRVGEAQAVLDKIHAQHPITNIWSHEETGNDWTYQRDRAVARWAKKMGIAWHESPSNGVVRRLKTRDGWAAKWAQTMRRTPYNQPACLERCGVESEPWPTASELGLTEDGCLQRQRGGRTQGLAILDSFLNSRGEGYQKKMSSPLTAFTACSRLSAHFTYGTLSMREVWHITHARTKMVAALPSEQKKTWSQDLRAFNARLRWRCHFIQKLEDEPAIEYENFHKAYDTVRPEPGNEVWLRAWQEGRTGYPLIDACMRALIATGWLNFRMRAMLVSFASYHLWLPWRRTAVYLARLFTDYEPGIHYSQCQMQSGTTGINTIRIYNPIKQSIDQDPDGVFIRQWVPELAAVSDANIHTPWLEPENMGAYPMPLVEEKKARDHAREVLFGLRKDSGHARVAQGIVRKHGSRKRQKPRPRSPSPPKPSYQRELPL